MMRLFGIHADYLVARAARRLLPERLTSRLMSNRRLPASELYAITRRYFEMFDLAGVRALHGDGPSEQVSVLEVGTGIYNPFSAPLLLAGVDRLLLLEPYPAGDVETPRLSERMRALLEAADRDDRFPFPKKRSIDEVLPSDIGENALPRGVELLLRSWEETELPDGSVDFILSISVLEHLRNPAAVLRESARILKPGGIMLNVVDLRDHYFRYPFEMLKFSEAGWKRLTTSKGGSGFLNRLRLSDWLQLHRDAHLVPEVVKRASADEASFARDRAAFRGRFAAMGDDDLRTLTARIVARKPDSPARS